MQVKYYLVIILIVERNLLNLETTHFLTYINVDFFLCFDV